MVRCLVKYIDKFMFTYVCMLKLGRTEPSRVLLSRTSDLFTDRG